MRKKWISSGGGPYICTTERQANRWLGADGLSLPIDKPTYGNFDRSHLLAGYEGTDYGWTSVIGKEFAFKLPGQDNDILVISDLPSDLTCLQMGRPGEFLAVKWVGADSEAQICEGLSNLDNNGYVSLSLDVVFNERNIVIFDSAWSTSDVGENIINLHIDVGRYSVYNRVYRPDASLELHILKFVNTELAPVI